MTYAILHRDGTFRRWDSEIDPKTVRPGCVLPQVVDPIPEVPPGGQLVEGEPVVGADSVRQTWIVVPPERKPVITALEFTDRITAAEWDALEGLGSVSADFRIGLRRLNRAHEVDLRDPQVAALLGGAAQFGAIKAERVEEILRY